MNLIPTLIEHLKDADLSSHFLCFIHGQTEYRVTKIDNEGISYREPNYVLEHRLHSKNEYPITKVDVRKKVLGLRLSIYITTE